MKINEKLKSRRLELGMTMLDVANIAGVSEATVSRWESGDIANMRRDKIVSLAKALQVTPSFIMDDETKQENISTDYLLSGNEITILQKYNRLNSTGQEKADTYISDLLENPKNVAEAYQSEYGYASVAADTGKNGRIPAPDFDTIIELNKDNQ